MNEKKEGARRRVYPLFLAASAVGALCMHQAGAATESWTASSANWGALANWNGGSGPVPGNGDTVDITSADAINRSINYNYTGAAVTLSSLTVDNDGGGIDTLSMTGNGLALSASNETIGDSGSLIIGGTGVMSQSVGVNTVNVDLILGDNGKDAGTYSLSGSGTLATNGFEDVGLSGAGTFTQSNGANTASGWLYLGYNGGANGTYNLTNGSLVSPSTSVGYNGTGTFTQSGGTFTSAQFITVGDQTGGSGTYNLTGGTISGSTLNLGYNSPSGSLAASTGTFNQTAGIATFTTIAMGQNTGALGVYSLSGSGILSVSTNPEYVGNSGIGSFTQTGGSNTAGGGLYLGYNSGSNGVYALSGAGSLSVGVDEFVGCDGGGTFNQTAGTNAVSSGGLYVSAGIFNSSAGMFQGGVSSTYSLSGTGALVMTGNASEFVGLAGPGTFIQTGGSNTARSLLLTYEPGSSGFYSLSGTGLLSASLGESIGYGGAGTFVQSGGSNISGGTFNVAEAGGGLSSTGFYSLSAGALFSSGAECVGQDNVGTFIQTGGVNTTNGSLTVGQNAGIGPGSGTYTLSGGSVNVGGAVIVGGGGPSILSVSGTGSLITPGTLEINAVPNASINFTGGTITAAALNFNGAPSAFAWTGGTLDLTSNVTWDPSAGNTTTGAAFASALTLGTNQTLMISGNETIGGNGAFNLTLSGGTHYVTGSITLNPTGTITQNGGTLFYSTFTQAGGTVNGTFQNQGAYIYQSGAFNGRLLNQGTVSFGPGFTAGNGIENDTSMSVNTGQTLTVNGAGLDNLGTFNLSGGVISGTGVVVNDFSGTLQGFGTINQILTNEGNLLVAGVLHLNGGFQNFGVVQGNGAIFGAFGNSNGGSLDIDQNDALDINGSWANSNLVTLTGGVLGGGTISNSGTIQGEGTIDATISNANGVIRAAGGELDLGAGVTNNMLSQIQSATGDTVLVVQGLTTNAGLIALAGGTFDNNNKSMSNLGTISGNGILRTGSLTNSTNGLILLTDADSSVYGPVINSSGGNIKIVSNTTTFYGAVTNNGTIKVTNGVANFLGNGVSMTVGGTYNSDPSDNYFNGLSTTSTGLVTGGSGDRFFLTNGSAFTNAGTFTDGGTLSANAVTNSGSFTQTGTLIETGNFTSSGSATIGGTQTWSPGTTFTNTAGTATFQSDAGSATASPLSFNVAGGTVALASAQHWGGLTVSGTGAVNVANYHIILSYGASDPIASIRGYLASGLHGGAWNGPGINSSAAAANSAYALGYADGADGVVSGLASGQIEIKYTLLGDANLDGVVNGDDFTILAGNIGKPVSGWDKGDFNYDGVDNGDDFTLLVGNLGKQTNGAAVALPASDYAAIDAFAAANGLMADVPEPGALTLLALGAMGALVRRRRAIQPE